VVRLDLKEIQLFVYECVVKKDLVRSFRQNVCRDVFSSACVSKLLIKIYSTKKHFLGILTVQTRMGLAEISSIRLVVTATHHTAAVNFVVNVVIFMKKT
jgi:hypothetical protein